MSINSAKFEELRVSPLIDLSQVPKRQDRSPPPPVSTPSSERCCCEDCPTCFSKCLSFFLEYFSEKKSGNKIVPYCPREAWAPSLHSSSLSPNPWVSREEKALPSNWVLKPLEGKDKLAPVPPGEGSLSEGERQLAWVYCRTFVQKKCPSLDKGEINEAFKAVGYESVVLTVEFYRKLIENLSEVELSRECNFDELPSAEEPAAPHAAAGDAPFVPLPGQNSVKNVAFDLAPIAHLQSNGGEGSGAPKKQVKPFFIQLSRSLLSGRMPSLCHDSDEDEWERERSDKRRLLYKDEKWGYLPPWKEDSQVPQDQLDATWKQLALDVVRWFPALKIDALRAKALELSEDASEQVEDEKRVIRKLPTEGVRRELIKWAKALSRVLSWLPEVEEPLEAIVEVIPSSQASMDEQEHEEDYS